MRALAGLGASALLLSTGCFSYTIDTPETPPVDARAAVRPDAAEVCVVRTSLAGGTHVVRDNGQLVGATMGQGYFCYGARPGPHRVGSEVGAKTAAIDLALSAGERVFLRQAYELEEVTLARMPEREARAAMDHLHYQRLVAAAEPVLAPPALASAAADLPPPPPPPPSSVPRRPAGLAYGVVAGLGLGSSRVAPQTKTTAGVAALGSIWAGSSVADLLVIAARFDASLVNGAAVADVALHLAFFPAADRPGPARDFVVFADGGVRPPTSAGSHFAGVGRLGVGWERWRLGPVMVGPFLAGQVACGEDGSDAAVEGGVGASLYPRAPKR